jgi:hypothetical protein
VLSGSSQGARERVCQRRSHQVRQCLPHQRQHRHLRSCTLAKAGAARGHGSASAYAASTRCASARCTSTSIVTSTAARSSKQEQPGRTGMRIPTPLPLGAPVLFALALSPPRLRARPSTGAAREDGSAYTNAARSRCASACCTSPGTVTSTAARSSKQERPGKGTRECVCQRHSQHHHRHRHRHGCTLVKAGAAREHGSASTNAVPTRCAGALRTSTAASIAARSCLAGAAREHGSAYTNAAPTRCAIAHRTRTVTSIPARPSKHRSSQSSRECV